MLPNRFYAIFAAAILLVLLFTPLTYTAQSGPIPGKYIALLKPGTKIDAVAKAAGANAKVKRAIESRVSSQLLGGEIWDRYVVIEVKNKALTASDVAAMIDPSLIESIEPDYYLEFFEFPSDPYFPQQWYLNNTGQDYIGIARIDGVGNDTLSIKHGTPGADINVSPYYQSPPTETTKVTVAIIDSGVDVEHPELKNLLWRNQDEIPYNGSDDDHNGYVDDTLGFDISGDSLSLFDPIGDNDPRDEVGHGTHIAGIVAAAADGIGVVGIAQTAEIMSVKIQPNATSVVGAAGVVYAVNAGAQVINISWGTPFESAVLLQALSFARQNGVFVAIAAGNSGDNTRFFPAGFDSTFVVGAANSDGYVTEFSTFGNHIDIVAPGLDILSLRAAGTDMYIDGGEPVVRIIGADSLYYLSDGTSMAAPMVAGAAAMMLSIRPDLSLDRLERFLKEGALDLVDPYGNGQDSLVGVDSISGAGYLDLNMSLNLLIEGGIAFVEPQRRQRYSTDVAVKVKPVDGYNGGWSLEYAYQSDPDNWQSLGSGAVLPADSILYTFNNGFEPGIVSLRVTDDFGFSRQIAFVYVRERRIEILYPAQDQLLAYGVAIEGAAYGFDFDSVMIGAVSETGLRQHLLTSSGEYFDSVMFSWAFSGTEIGKYMLIMSGYFQDTTLADSIDISVARAFSAGWPQSYAGNGGMTAVCTDLNRDGIRELAVPTTRGMYLYLADGTVVDGWPVNPTRSMLSVPAVYDVDNDGEDELICTNDSGLHVFNYDGTYADGWPQYCYTGLIPYEYGYPNPTVVQLGYEGDRDDSAIVFINKIGDIRAYQFDGTPYFYSLGGIFASYNPRVSPTAGFGGSTSPMVTAAKLLGGDSTQIIGSYSSGYPYSGIGLFKAKNGLPAVDTLGSPLVQRISLVNGTALGDLDQDGEMEIVTSGNDTTGQAMIWVKDRGSRDLPGWPKVMSDVRTWISSYPVLADLDLDGIPEILITYFYYDISCLYIFRADGTPYATMDGRPEGQAFFYTVTFGTPTVANISGDEYPEILMRSGYIIPGTGIELLWLLDHLGNQLELSPIATLARPREVFSSRFAPLVDDLDGDGRVEVILLSDANQVLVWDFPASINFGKNKARYLADNLNSGIYHIENIPTDVPDDVATLPDSPTLSQNYPNPFNPSTTIKFTLPAPADVSLEVFNLGQKVVTLVDGPLGAGPHEVVFDASEYASAIYFYRLKAGDFRQVRKMALVK